MQKYSRFARFALAAAFVSVASAQSSITLIGTNPNGAIYNVDGQNYSQPTSALWPAGSKHVLSVSNTAQSSMIGEQLVFSNWVWAGGSFAGNSITVTSDPAITAYTAMFNALYALSVNFYPCDGTGDPGPGTVYVNGAATNCNEQIYVGAGSAVTVQAIPNNGYVFVGWYTATNQTIIGFQSTVTMNAPTSVYPHFAPARNINFVTSPAGLQILADYSTITAPYTLQWGFDTVHTVGVISPQVDITGNPWVFSSWSDGGAATHAYTVAEITTPALLTAVYSPGVGAVFQTSPPELNLTVDGASNAPPYNFIWSAGATHTVSAPAQQTDSTGHVWGFSAWSNGGAAAQSLTVPAYSVGGGIRMVATYTPVGHLIVNSTLAGVSVTVNGSACATPCNVTQPVGTQIDVAAPASVPQGTVSRQQLSGWTGGSTGGPTDLIVTLSANPITVYANYYLMNYLALSSSPANSAAWTAQPASPDGFYSSNTTVSVSAAPQTGFKFQDMTGDLTGSNSSGSVVMSAPRAVLAMMTKIPYVAPTGIENGAGTTPVNAIAPGSVASLFGGNLAAGTAVAPASPLPQTLGGVSVMLGERLLPLFFVSPSQMNFQLPADVQPGAATLTVVSAGTANVTATFTVVQDAPGLFQQIVNGQSFALAFHADGTLVTQTSLAQIGELLTVYGTGFGPTNPARPEGFAVPAAPVYTATDPVSVSAGSGTLAPSATFALAGSIGVDAVQFTLTDPSLSGTNAGLSITINGQQSNTVLVPVQ
ncbi:MAG: hypothetical protein ABSG03_40495 [Bryobacteraceae bacterium]|jgi:uncharacterized protein (TIGR03437 family)